MRDLTVTEAAKMVGVSRARVYQRITGQAGGWDPGRPMPVILVPCTSRGARNGRQMRIDFDLALEWRQERLTAGLPVGPIPDADPEDAVPPPPVKPPKTAEPASPVVPIGMPSVRIF
jgi:hypothetical protein